MIENCAHCGRAPENDQATHWLGCEEITLQHFEAGQVALDPVVICEYGDCSNPKRPQGKGPKPKYCTEHSDPKNRK
ncbi:hypothetical protein ACWC0A_30485 [Streptomyces scopuliridis]